MVDWISLRLKLIHTTSGLVASEHVVVALVGVVFRPTWAGLVHQAILAINHVCTSVAVGNRVAGDSATGNRLAIIETHLCMSRADRTHADHKRDHNPRH